MASPRTGSDLSSSGSDLSSSGSDLSSFRKGSDPSSPRKSGDSMASSPRRASGAVKLIDLKVAAEEKMTKAGARISEKVVLVRLNLALGLRRIIRHEQTPRHDKCLNYVAETQTAATERRLRKEQEARERAQWERAMAREWSAYKSSRRASQKSLARTHLEHESRSHQQLLQGAA